MTVPGFTKIRGSILIFVLGIVVLLGALCLRLREETVQELRHVSQFHKRDDLRLHAYSLLDITVGVLNEFRTLDSKSLKTGGGWEKPLEWSELTPLDPRVRWSVSFQSESGESGKAPLFSTNEKVFKEIFAIMDNGSDRLVDEAQGQAFYDAWMDWQDSDSNEREEGAEDDYYEDQNPSYFTPGENIRSFDEFRMIKGFGYDSDSRDDSGLFFDKYGNETENMQNFRKSFSFYHEGSVNLFEASDFLLRYICGDDDDIYEKIRSGELNAESPRMQVDSPIPISWGTSPTLRVNILVMKGKARFQLHAVLTDNDKIAVKPKSSNQIKRSDLNSKLKYPFRVFSLRENENLID